MKKNERKLLLYQTDQMFDIEKLKEEEPELFKDLCKDYPVKKNVVYMIEVKGDK